MEKPTIEELSNYAKKTGIVYPTAEIYGGLAGFWDYGPRGVELKNNLKQLWWKEFVKKRSDMYGLDGATITHPKVWKASGHVETFTDPVVICANCKNQERADHLIEKAIGVNVEGKTIEEIEQIIRENKVRCPKCGSLEWSTPQNFNLMFKTYVGVKEDKSSEAYLRPETAQNIFVNFKNVFEVARKKLPLGIAQIGKAYRNEISPRNFLFRSREFEQAEIEYFYNPLENLPAEYLEEIDLNKEVIVYTKQNQIELLEPEIMSLKSLKNIINNDWHFYWIIKAYEFLLMLGIDEKNLRLRQHLPDELSFYSSDTWDVEYNFSIGWKEIIGIANRGDYDLRQHTKESGKDLRVHIEQINDKIFPNVIEPSFGVDRILLAILSENLTKDGKRTLLKISPKLAPIKVLVAPLVKKDGLDEKAKEIYKLFKSKLLDVVYDESGSIGRRYARADEIGIPFAITIDYDTLKDNTITIRYRDTTEQKRMTPEEALEHIKKQIL